MKFTFLFLVITYLNVSFAQTIDVISLTNDTICNKGFNYQINYQANGSFNPGNVFYPQISDENGSFAAGYNASNYSSAATSGFFYTTMFNGLPAGTGYRFRIVSSNPVVYGSDNGYDVTLFYPDLTVISTPGQLEATTSFPGTDFQWLECSHFELPGEISSTFTSGTVGTEYAIEITQSGCTDTSDCEIFLDLNTINEQGLESTISIAPNPTQGEFSVHLGTVEAEVKINVYENNGRLVSSIIEYGVLDIPLSINGENGLYFVEVILDNSRPDRFKVLKN